MLWLLLWLLLKTMWLKPCEYSCEVKPPLQKWGTANNIVFIKTLCRESRLIMKAGTVNYVLWRRQARGMSFASEP